jgi:pimeloyl-ACP methyl ester carboxylesterase
MKVISKLILTLILCFSWAFLPMKAMSAPQKIGIVIMHGKGSSPSGKVSGLASFLESKGYLVANLEMPWSGKRDYDVNVSAAEEEVEAALSALRSKGAQKVFVAGHSQGGVFTLHFSGKHIVDGIICIAPGGNVGGTVFLEKLGGSVARAKQLVAEGKGGEKARLDDFEGKKGTYPVVTTPAVYLTWFDPDGAMNSDRAARVVNPLVPIFWIVAKNDYPNLRKTNIPMFETLPKNPRTRLYEPDADHISALSESRDEIVRWIAEVVSTK